MGCGTADLMSTIMHLHETKVQNILAPHKEAIKDREAFGCLCDSLPDFSLS